MAHDPRLIKHEDSIEDLKPAIPDWIKNLKRPATPCVVPAFGPLEGIRDVGTDQLIAHAHLGPKLANSAQKRVAGTAGDDLQPSASAARFQAGLQPCIPFGDPAIIGPI